MPDLRGRAPIHFGNSTGLSSYNLGQQAGSETTTLNVNQMPGHNHILMASTEDNSVVDPTNASLGRNHDSGAFQDKEPLYVPESGIGAMVATNPANIASVGGSQPHSNIQPVLAINFIIALQGVYPSRD